MLIDILWLICLVFLLALWASALFSYITIVPGSGLDSFRSAVNAVVNPVLNPVRKVLPMARIGGSGVDLSPLVVSIAVIVVMRLL